jgi:FtsP/CotA-like multicopper oxidase with cupredoxin domain
MANAREVADARTNRLEIIKAGLKRRDLFKMGLLTGAGYLVRKNGLSAWAFDEHCGPGACNPGCSPRITPFLDPLPIPPVLPERTLADPGLMPAPREFPNNAINPINQLPFEGRGQFNGTLRPGTDNFQFFTQYPVQHYFIQRMRANPNFRITSDTNIPAQTIWGFNQGGSDPNDVAVAPGPTIVGRYQQPIVIRRFNELPPQNQNGGFGVPETSTHLHNFHAGTESDGGPCRYFFRGQYFDYYDTLQQAGFASTNPPNGDVNESMSTLWYHDHRVDHTAENVYKGLAGFHLFFNNFDTGDEGSGFHLPSFPAFDIPILLADKLIDPGTGLICFDTFENDGLVGDIQLANGKVQPFLEVSQRRYRFRILDGGPSRFYQLFLTNPNNLNQVIPFWVTSFRVGVAERYDVIIDFKQIAAQFGTSVVRLENRLQQNDGRAPTNNILGAGRGTYCLEFRIGNQVADGSVDPATAPHFYNLPSTSLTDPTVVPRITRTFTFDQSDGGWVVNDRFMSCNQVRFTVQRNSVERWILQNEGGEWQHPIHIHLEEFQILRRDSRISAAVEHSRKDTLALNFDERAELFFRFRDFRGDYPMHCHNTIHEDHAMMLLFQVQDVGDNKTQP